MVPALNAVYEEDLPKIQLRLRPGRSAGRAVLASKRKKLTWMLDLV
jgi:hypothetical protein